MKYRMKLPILCSLILCGILVLHLSGISSFAAEEGGGSGAWRPTYDLVMMWVNFLILAFVGVKFGKKPIMNFLKGQKTKIEREIGQLEDEKNRIVGKIQESLTILEESDKRFETIRERIVHQGERKKKTLIEEARIMSEAMIEDAQRKARSQIQHAKEEFHQELVERATEIALKRLPKEMTPEDDQKFVENYLSAVC